MSRRAAAGVSGSTACTSLPRSCLGLPPTVPRHLSSTSHLVPPLYPGLPPSTSHLVPPSCPSPPRTSLNPSLLWPSPLTTWPSQPPTSHQSPARSPPSRAPPPPRTTTSRWTRIPRWPPRL